VCRLPSKVLRLQLQVIIIQDKKFRTTDYMYEENIKTILLYPKPQPGADAAAAILAPPVITLDQSLP
jgi:hypothetical protein